MKTTLQLLFAACLFSLLALPGHSQTILWEDFNNPGNWTTYGTATGGDMNVGSGRFNFNNLQGGQSRRLVRDLGYALNDNTWRMEWQTYMSGGLNASTGMLMAFTSNTNHPRSNSNGSDVENNNNTLEVHMSNPATNTTQSNHSIWVSSKEGTNRGVTSRRIPVNFFQWYYFRLERISSSQVILNIFTDPGRTQHVSGSPACVGIDPNIDDLRYVQMGVWTSAGSNRRFSAWTDNLSLNRTPISTFCNQCEIDADLTVTLDSRQNCRFKFQDNSRTMPNGPQTNNLTQITIDFGDGSSTTIPPGGSTFHSYTFPPGIEFYEACLTARGCYTIASISICCEQSICRRVGSTKCSLPKWDGPEVDPEFTFTLSPNPSSGKVCIQSTEEILSVQIFNLQGALVKEYSINNHQYGLDLSDLAAGVYQALVRLENHAPIQKKLILDQ